MRLRGISFWLITTLVLFTGGIAQADLQAEFAATLKREGVVHTRYSLYVVDLDANRELVAINCDTPLMPASNLKVVTTAAALSALGPDFTFHTRLKLLERGDDGTATLLIQGDGDPAFGDPKILAQGGMDVEQLLQVWVKAIRDTGVKKISRLWIDDRIFDYEMVHPTWPKGQLDSWYCAQVSGLTFFDNCLDVLAEPTSAGRPAVVHVTPGVPFLPIVNRAVTGAADSFLVNRKLGTNEITFGGLVKNRSVEPKSVTVHDPAALLAQILAHRLGQAGIEVQAISRPARGQSFVDGQLLYDVQTPLPTVLARCLKDSQNLFAECLIKRVGYAAGVKAGSPQPAPGSWENGTAAVLDFLTRQAGVRPGEAVLADGSGMSRDNAVSARCLVQVLAAMHRDPRNGPIFLSSLSVAGQDGTLDKRLKEGLHGQVYGKTGFIDRVSSLSGYLVIPAVGPDGKPTSRTIAFSMLFNNTGEVPIKPVQDKLVRLIDAEMAGR